MENENIIEIQISKEVNTETSSNYTSTGSNSNRNSILEEAFNEITEETVKLWETILAEDISDSICFVKDDADLLNEALDMQNQKVIKNDCDRTRVKDKSLMPSFREYLECMLTYYCKKNDIKYKQGMNEIVGPFILLKSKISISLSRVYNMFACFMRKFLTNYYHEDEFYSLQSSLAMLNLLLKYHDPVMFNVFEFSIITPEMYATSWVLTIFANKTKLSVLYHLWDIIIRENDELFVHFVVIGFLLYNKEVIVTADHSQIPSVLSQLSLKNNIEVEAVAQKARELRRSTPLSLRLMARKLEIFKPHSDRLKELFFVYEPETMMALPVLPCEIFSIAYNNIISCPDYSCKNFVNKYDGDIIHPPQTEDENNEETPDNFKCYNCDRKLFNNQRRGSLSNAEENKQQIPQMNYILLDLRLSEEKNNEKNDVKPGFLPMTVIMDQEELNSENFAENLSDRFLGEKDKYHFVLITSETDYFKEYEDRFYKESLTEKDKKRMMYGLQTKVAKEISENMVKQSLKKDKSKRLQLKLKEFDNLRKLVKNFLTKNYPYVSYVLGGFKEIHDQSMKYNIPLLNHDDKCYICKKEKKKTKKKFGFFTKFFKFNKKKPDDVQKGVLHHHNTQPHSHRNDKQEEPKEKVREKSPSKSFEEQQKDVNILSKIFIKLESDFNNDFDGGKIIENLNKIEADPSNLFTIDDISTLISNPNYVVYTCLLIEYKHLYNKIDNKPPQIMLFLDNKEIKIYKLDRGTNIRNSNGLGNKTDNEALSFILIETIKFSEIITIITKKQTKNVITIQFTSDLFGKTSMMIDLITDVDSKSFIYRTKKAIELNQEKK